MPIVEPAELKARLPAGKRLLGLDLGTETIGLALSDTRLSVATPYKTLKRGRFTVDATTLMQIVDAEDVGGLVLGLPLNMDGSSGPRVQATRAFARNLVALNDILIAFWDERLSTAAVTRLMIDADLSRKKRQERVDRLAAAHILEGLLDRLARLPSLADSAVPTSGGNTAE